MKIVVVVVLFATRVSRRKRARMNAVDIGIKLALLATMFVSIEI